MFPKEKELLLTYNIIEDEYLGAITKEAIEKPMDAARMPARIITHTLRHNTLIICNKSIE